MATGILISSDEFERLHGCGPLATNVYLWLRSWMDFGTGEVGKAPHPISLGKIRAHCERHIPRGSGVQVEQPTEKEVRVALDALVRAGLVERLTQARQLIFRLICAVTDLVRPERTGHGAGTNRARRKAREPNAKNTKNQSDEPAEQQERGTDEIPLSPQTGHTSVVRETVKESPSLRSGREGGEEAPIDGELLPAVPPVPSESLPKKSSLSDAMRALCSQTWEAYCAAFVKRYGVAPVRNAKVNRNVVDFVKRLGGSAPAVAEFYVSHSGGYYVRCSHEFGPLLRDAEGLHTQWSTGRRMTNTTARQVDQTAANAVAAASAMDLLQRKYTR